MEQPSSHYCCSSQIGEMSFVTWHFPDWNAVQGCSFRSHRRLGLEREACPVSSAHQQRHSVSSGSFLIFDLGVGAALAQIEMVRESSLDLIRWNRSNVVIVELA